LESQGLKVLRFWDNEALQQMDRVLEEILRVLDNQTLSSGPSSNGRGEFRQE
jgi:very-short-patch-repair endonuclease